jgi:hypothetical protein
MQRMEVTATAGKSIEISTFNTSGAKTNTHRIDLSKK